MLFTPILIKRKNISLKNNSKKNHQFQYHTQIDVIVWLCLPAKLKMASITFLSGCAGRQWGREEGNWGDFSPLCTSGSVSRQRWCQMSILWQLISGVLIWALLLFLFVENLSHFIRSNNHFYYRNLKNGYKNMKNMFTVPNYSCLLIENVATCNCTIFNLSRHFIAYLYFLSTKEIWNWFFVKWHNADNAMDFIPESLVKLLTTDENI